eukprot:6958-Eustigmatos_ZCMA.PRE.1
MPPDVVAAVGATLTFDQLSQNPFLLSQRLLIPAIVRIQPTLPVMSTAHRSLVARPTEGSCGH